ncbi:hypothetical protein M436DRAFT_64595 [Aureobasidium namibiae CBS 147.97]|uniref:Uncharacterized protein n=1 Tax=Aureobasidium namibiae CBS 147.97 TaxID=1043004 RepID=A0A074XDA9_9PEZI
MHKLTSTPPREFNHHNTSFSHTFSQSTTPLYHTLTSHSNSISPSTTLSAKMVKVYKNQYLSEKQCQKAYAAYALNIDNRWFDVKFGTVGEPYEIIGANKSFRSGINGVIFRTMTMKTTDVKFRVVVYRGESVKYVQDSFELDVGNKMEILKVMRERATGGKQEKVFYVEDQA